MALQVWLPLNGNLNNNGLATLTTSGTPNYINGKMGKSLSLASKVTFNGLPKLTQFSIAFWAKVDSCTVDWADLVGFTSKQADGTAAAPFRFEATISTRGCSFHNNTPYAITQASEVLITEAQKGTWHHCCFTYSGAQCFIYVDGIHKYTHTGLGGYLIDEFHIGETGNMVGGLNDLRIYDECLSLKQIKELAKGLVAHYPLTGPGGYENLILTSDKIVSGAQGSGITRTYESDGSMKIVSTSGNGNYCSIGFTESSNTNVGANMAVGDAYVISCDIKVEEGTAFPTLFINSGNGYKALQGDITKINEWQRVYYKSTWAEPGTSYGNISLHLGFSGAIGTYYFKNFKLEKGTELTAWIPAPTDDAYIMGQYNESWGEDVSGYGYHGEVVGTPGFGAKAPRYCGNIQMFGDYINNIPSPLTASTDAFTFMCWYYPTAHTTGALYNNRTSVGNGVSVFHIGENVRFDTSESSQYTAGTLTLNKWQHIACTYDKTNSVKKIYINGVQVGATTTIGNLDSVGTIASIGASSVNDTGGGNTVSGAMSDVRIYGTALTDTDIKALYNQVGQIDNFDKWYAYNFMEFSNNKLEDANNSLCDKVWTNGLWYYQQANCQVSMTDEGIRIYRTPNIVHDSSTMHNMWGGFRISPMTVNASALQKGHTYIILLDVKGQTTNAASCGWTNQMGWGGGGLSPTPSDVVYSWVPTNWQSDEYVTFFYKWTIEDDIYKTCTSSYSSFVEGEEYISYRDFCFNFNYQDTGELGTDIYIRNLRCYDITNLNSAIMEQTGTMLAAALQETNQLARIHLSGEIGGNEFIEI